MIKNNQCFVCINFREKVLPAKKGKCRNHCTNCFYSLHVDITPGDRENGCKGLMEPLKIETRKGKLQIFHRCTKCGYKMWNKIQEDDKINATFLKLIDND